MRNLVFISHANPQDNDAALWISTQLSGAGYLVWSDVTKLIGGEQMWSEIDEAIRNHACKFVFLLSKHSNSKPGTLAELNLAKTVGKNYDDFIIPLRIDELDYADVDIRLHGMLAIDAGQWAEGLASLLKKLQEDDVPKPLGDQAHSAVNQWWSGYSRRLPIVQQSEELLSNWFEISTLPKSIYIYELRGEPTFDPGIFPYYYNSTNMRMLSFASEQELGLKGARATRNLLTSELVLERDYANGHRDLVALIRLCWENYLSSRGMPRHMMSSNISCFYFTDELLAPRKRIDFSFGTALKGKRSLVGKSNNRCWHYGLTMFVQFKPIPSIVLQSHVVFSDDGKHTLDSTRRMQAMRRSACKDWWNDHWRDRMLAAMQWIGAGENIIELPVSHESVLAFSAIPMVFKSDVGYDDSLLDSSAYEVLEGED